jgi:hypothetical protein
MVVRPIPPFRLDLTVGLYDAGLAMRSIVGMAQPTDA